MMITSTKQKLFFVFVTTLLAGDVREASADSVELSVGAGAHFVPLESMDALSDDNAYIGFAMGLGLALPGVTLVPGTSTEVTLGYETGFLQGETFQIIESELVVSTFSLSGRIRRQLFSRGSAFLQAGIGWQRAELSLMEVGGDRERRLEGSSQAVSGLTSIGLDLAIFKRPTTSFSLSFRGEFGYQASTSLQMDASPSGSDSLSIETQSRDLGSVNTSGATLKWGFVGSI